MKTLKSMKRIAIFASGDGSNAENIIRYFQSGDNGGEVVLVVCNKPDAKVIQRSHDLGVPAVVMSKAQINDRERMMAVLDSYSVDLIVLAGFLLMIPPFLIAQYRDRIINIHPSLLPKFGGKGMYGRHVHEAVVDAREEITGITIHLVDEEYDSGRFLFQASVAVTPADTPAEVECKVRALELQHYPRVIADALAHSNKTGFKPLM